MDHLINIFLLCFREGGGMRPLVIQEPTLDLASEPIQTLAQICPI